MNRGISKRFYWGLFLVFAFVALRAEESKPNVVLMLADDLGYNDLSCYGSEKQETPVLDKLAGEGLRLTSFYAGASVCTPSRMALLTGAYPPRLGWQGGVVGYGVKVHNGLAPEARTIAEIFQDAGYATALIGKWHLGDTPELHPQNQGFEKTFFIDKSNNQTKKLWRGSKVEADPFDNRRLTENFIREGIKFIRSNKKKPFFLYLPFTAPHFPAQAHPQWKGKSYNSSYGDVVVELDARIGTLLEVLKTEGLEKKTIVVFLSDNGTEPGQKKWGSSFPYRGLKWSSLEGGTRVPCIIRYPEILQAGEITDKLIAAIDLLPTLAGACGIELQKGSGISLKIDGLNLWESLKNETTTPVRTNLLYWNGWATPQAIRVGKWKLYFDRIKELDDSEKGPVLIDLTEDPGEKNNLAAQFAGKVVQMKNEAIGLLEKMSKNTISIGGPVQVKSNRLKEPKWLH